MLRYISIHVKPTVYFSRYRNKIVLSLFRKIALPSITIFPLKSPQLLHRLSYPRSFPLEPSQPVLYSLFLVHLLNSRVMFVFVPKYRNNIINVIALRFRSILCPVKNNPTAMDHRIIPVKRLKLSIPRK